MTRSVEPKIGLGQCAVLVEGLDHPEGVMWDPTHDVVYAGGEAGQLYAISSDRRLQTVAEAGGFMLGLALDGDGLVYACNVGQRRVLRIEPANGHVEVYSVGTTSDPMRAPNYPAFGRHGELYVTDSGTWGQDDGLIYRIDPGGNTEVWTRNVRAYPNGCCLSRETDALFVVESTRPGLSRVPIAPDGSAGRPEIVCELPSAVVPDGVAADAAGGLCIACYRPDRVYHAYDGGAVEVLLDDPHGISLLSPTNIAFAGPELERAIFANLSGWHLTTVDLGLSGAPVPRPRVAR